MMVRWMLAVVGSAMMLCPMMLEAVPGTKDNSTLGGQDTATYDSLMHLAASPHRTPMQRARDHDRHPIETLTFFGIKKNMAVLDVSPDSNGWYTELLAPLLRDQGQYVAALWDAKSDSPYERAALQAFKAKLAARPDLYSKVSVVALQPPHALHPVKPQTIDLVVSIQALHLWLLQDTAPAMLGALFTALKPGGLLGIVDNRADPLSPTDTHAKLGYVNEAYAIDLIKSVGFEFLEASDVNSNPKDARDYDQGVWALPPTYRMGDKDRSKYTEIGESDRFTLKFRKPSAR
jgi:predicted methyltransferase